MRHTHYLHPGEILKEDFLAGYGLSVNAAAKAMGLPRTRLNDIVRGVALPPIPPYASALSSATVPNSGSTCKATMIWRRRKQRLKIA